MQAGCPDCIGDVSISRFICCGVACAIFQFFLFAMEFESVAVVAIVLSACVTLRGNRATYAVTAYKSRGNRVSLRGNRALNAVAAYK